MKRSGKTGHRTEIPVITRRVTAVGLRPRQAAYSIVSGHVHMPACLNKRVICVDGSYIDDDSELYAPQVRISEYMDLLPEFVQHILKCKARVISDKSQLDEFYQRAEDLEALYRRIEERYGIDAREWRYIVDVLAQIRLKKHPVS